MACDISQILMGCKEFGKVLDNLLQEPAASAGPDVVQQATKLHEGIQRLQFLLEEERRKVDTVPKPFAGIFPNTLEVQHLLQELETVNGTIRALDEMMAAESMPLVECLGLGAAGAPGAPASRTEEWKVQDAHQAQAPALNTLPPVPSSATLPGEPAIGGGMDAEAELDQVLLDAPQPSRSSASVIRDALVPSRRLADAEDTAHVASLLCSPETLALQDIPPPKPDSQQLFQVVPVEAEVDVGRAPTPAKSRLGMTRKRRRRAWPTQQIDDVIESFSEYARSQEVQSTLEREQEMQREAGRELQPLQNLPAIVPYEPYDGCGPAGQGKRELPSLYKHVIDVTDDADHLPKPLMQEEHAAAHNAVVPYVPPAKPAEEQKPAKQAKRRRTLLSQRVRLSQMHLASQSQKGVTASQRLCASLTRRAGQKSRRRKGWVLDPEDAQDAQDVLNAQDVQEAQGNVRADVQVAGAQVVHPVEDPLDLPKASTPERPNVLFSGFSRSDLHQLKASVNCLGGSAVRDLPSGSSASETRVVVRCTSESGKLIAGARTIKYLDAVLAGAWVLSPEWVHASMRAGHWLAEAKFQLQGDPAAFGGPVKGRQHGPELFAGFRFHFAQANAKKRKESWNEDGPAPHELVRLARRAGAEVLETLRKLPDGTEDPPHLAGDLVAKRKRKRPGNSAKDSGAAGLPQMWWRKPIMVTMPSAKVPSKGRSERAVKLANELGWVILPSSWMLDCISHGEVRMP
mmetsp:Transcript_71739/g.171411  ORF Transcript_71739/g.171411 Transcript_71739/m.171411 type:complete len:742 (+) Transcript_71739:120-2345(+)